MVRLSLVLAVIAALGFIAPQASASDCAVDEYEHNNSLMEVQVCDGGDLSISYVRPRRGIARQGVKDGTLLFSGTEEANGRVSGTARIFSARCGPITYRVKGRNRGRVIKLYGEAPRRDRDCEVIGYRDDELIFTRK
jgi:hypothetical protein